MSALHLLQTYTNIEHILVPFHMSWSVYFIIYSVFFLCVQTRSLVYSYVTSKDIKQMLLGLLNLHG